MRTSLRKLAVFISWVTTLLVVTAHGAEMFRPTDTQTSGQPLDPAEALRRMRVPEGFKVTLAAAEPDVRQPIAITYDERGRLWLAESYSYSGSDFSNDRRDRILIFEDRDGDGVFETRKVFHDHLNRLTGLAVGFGGVWVTTPPTLSFIPDRDHDDRPDSEPEVQLDGWTLKAEHNSVNGLTWGPDGWLYGRHGIKETSRPGRPGASVASRPQVSCAIWRFHPVRHVFEIVAEGTINPWGLDFDAYGQMFISSSVVDHLWHVVPGSKFKRWVGRDIPLYPHVYDLMGPTNDHSHRPSERQSSVDATDAANDFAGGAAHSEAMIYLGDRWPEEYRGSVFFSNIHGRRINRDQLKREPNNGRFVASHARDFLRANDPWFRAISMCYGPDGDVVMTDWSDFGECHDRDGVHRNSGRIYKLSWGEPRLVAANLRVASSDELVVLQRHANEWFPRQARRVLQERASTGQDMTAVHARLRILFDSEPSPVIRLRALWSLHVTGGADTTWIAKCLGDVDENVRYWAIRLLADGGQVDAASASLIVNRSSLETSWLVRMALASALPSLAEDARWTVGATLASRLTPSDDPNLARFVWMGWQNAAAARVTEAIEVMAKTHAPVMREWMARRLAEEAAKDPAIVRKLLAGIEELSSDAVNGPLSGLAAGLSLREYAIGENELKTLRRYYADERPTVRTAALAAGSKLRDPTAIRRYREILNDGTLPPGPRVDALRTLAEIHPDWLASDLLGLFAKQQLAEPVIRALAACDDPRIGGALVAAYSSLSASAKGAAIDTLIARPGSLAVLLDAIAGRQIPAKNITPGQARQVVKTASNPLKLRFEQLWGRVNSSPAAVAEQIKKLRATMKPDFLQLADRGHGASLFEQRCAVCHTLFGRGGKIGPDLTGSGRKEIDYLILNVADPNAEIGADWRLTIVTLNDGRVISGSVAAETDASLTLQSQSGVTTIERANVRTLERMEASLMPTGLLDDLPSDHIRDLLAFLMSDEAVPGPATKK